VVVVVVTTTFVLFVVESLEAPSGRVEDVVVVEVEVLDAVPTAEADARIEIDQSKVIGRTTESAIRKFLRSSATALLVLTLATAFTIPLPPAKVR
jgi:transaldolase